MRSLTLHTAEPPSNLTSEPLKRMLRSSGSLADPRVGSVKVGVKLLGHLRLTRAVEGHHKRITYTLGSILYQKCDPRKETAIQTLSTDLNC